MVKLIDKKIQDIIKNRSYKINSKLKLYKLTKTKII